MADQSLTNEQVAALAVINYLANEMPRFWSAWDRLPAGKRLTLTQGLESVIDRAYRVP